MRRSFETSNFLSNRLDPAVERVRSLHSLRNAEARLDSFGQPLVFRIEVHLGFASRSRLSVELSRCGMDAGPLVGALHQMGGRGVGDEVGDFFDDGLRGKQRHNGGLLGIPHRPSPLSKNFGAHGDTLVKAREEHAEGTVGICHHQMLVVAHQHGGVDFDAQGFGVGEEAIQKNVVHHEARAEQMVAPNGAASDEVGGAGQEHSGLGHGGQTSQTLCRNAVV